MVPSEAEQILLDILVPTNTTDDHLPPASRVLAISAALDSVSPTFFAPANNGWPIFRHFLAGNSTPASQGGSRVRASPGKGGGRERRVCQEWQLVQAFALRIVAAGATPPSSWLLAALADPTDVLSELTLWSAIVRGARGWRDSFGITVSTPVVATPGPPSLPHPNEEALVGAAAIATQLSRFLSFSLCGHAGRARSRAMAAAAVAAVTSPRSPRRGAAAAAAARDAGSADLDLVLQQYKWEALLAILHAAQVEPVAGLASVLPLSRSCWDLLQSQVMAIIVWADATTLSDPTLDTDALLAPATTVWATLARFAPPDVVFRKSLLRSYSTIAHEYYHLPLVREAVRAVLRQAVHGSGEEGDGGRSLGSAIRSFVEQGRRPTGDGEGGADEDDASDGLGGPDDGGEADLRSSSSGSEDRSDGDVDWSLVRPPWQPDSDASACTACARSFTRFRRRHHCRRCALIFCAGCSRARVPLPDLGYRKSVRVCVDCAADVAGAQTDDREGGGEGGGVVQLEAEDALHSLVDKGDLLGADEPLTDDEASPRAQAVGWSARCTDTLNDILAGQDSGKLRVRIAEVKLPSQRSERDSIRVSPCFVDNELRATLHVEFESVRVVARLGGATTATVQGLTFDGTLIVGFDDTGLRPVYVSVERDPRLRFRLDLSKVNVSGILRHAIARALRNITEPKKHFLPTS